MDSTAGSEATQNDSQPGLVDVTQLPLRDLTTMEDSVLGMALRRIVNELDYGHDVIAAFSSAP